MDVFCLSYKAEKGNFVSDIISRWTGDSITHTAGFTDGYFFELDGTNKDTHYKVEKYGTLKKFLSKNPEAERIIAHKIPYDFDSAKIVDGLNFFLERQKDDTKYGYSKLLRFLYLSKIDSFLKNYYIIKGKPYVPTGDRDGYDVCSEAFGIFCRLAGWWITAIDPKYSYLVPETMTPGRWYTILKDYTV